MTDTNTDIQPEKNPELEKSVPWDPLDWLNPEDILEYDPFTGGEGGRAPRTEVLLSRELSEMEEWKRRVRLVGRKYLEARQQLEDSGKELDELGRRSQEWEKKAAEVEKLRAELAEAREQTARLARGAPVVAAGEAEGAVALAPEPDSREEDETGQGQLLILDEFLLDEEGRTTEESLGKTLPDDD